MWTNLKLSKAQISKTIQSEEFLGSLLSKLAGPLMKVSIPLAKNLLAPLGITKIKRTHGSGTTTLIISNDEINDMMKIVQALEDSNILLKGVTKTIKNKTKEPKGGFLYMLLGTLGAILLGNLLSGKEIVRAGFRNKKGKGIVRELVLKIKKGKELEKLVLVVLEIFSAASSLNKLWNTKVLSKWTKI